MKSRQSPAMVPAPAVAVGAPAITGVVMCAVSLVASAQSQPLRIELPKVSVPKVSIPKVSLPKLPEINLDLPKFGKKPETAPAKKPSSSSRAAPVAPSAGQVKVRAAKGVVPSGSATDAPTLAEVTGQTTQDSIKLGAGYKKFPERRMPGANMDGWKKIAKDIAPEV